MKYAIYKGKKYIFGGTKEKGYCLFSENYEKGFLKDPLVRGYYLPIKKEDCERVFYEEKLFRWHRTMETYRYRVDGDKVFIWHVCPWNDDKKFGFKRTNLEEYSRWVDISEGEVVVVEEDIL